MKLNKLILLLTIMTSLVMPLVNLELFNSEIALGKTPQKRIIKGSGVNFIDDNNDWVSDGETRGAGVDEILGTFLLPTANK
ncbi:MAG: hypothetical protein PT118_12755 [Aphanizomenon gracile PMC644.10]|jgi:hypothetical protein|uniref:hypothetical protein n=1 Tax=Dolichospermum sp. LEGE 00240 TaxID=1828603 RepID=UPI00188263B9|nr:hypothetical protein [Dolichospermum sp. LEGE 00240]MDM3860687.1 hypothetical protein [Aphanizomenon gracile PMC644.10]